MSNPLPRPTHKLTVHASDKPVSLPRPTQKLTVDLSDKKSHKNCNTYEIYTNQG